MSDKKKSCKKKGNKNNSIDCKYYEYPAPYSNPDILGFPIPEIPWFEPNCEFKDNCKSKGIKCRRCRNNKRVKEDHFDSNDYRPMTSPCSNPLKYPRTIQRPKFPLGGYGYC